MKSFLAMLDAGAETLSGGGGSDDGDDATVALVDDSDSDQESFDPEPPVKNDGSPKKKRRWLWGVAIVAVSAAIGAGAYLIPRMGGGVLPRLLPTLPLPGRLRKNL